MAQREKVPGWLQAEREYADELERRGTIPELFETSAERHLHDDAQLYKGGIYNRSLSGVIPPADPGTYETLSYGEMRDIVRTLAAGFRDLGLEAGDRVGIYANTRMEWAQTDFALLAAGCVVTTIYTESSPSQIEYLLNDPGADVVVVENEELLERLLEVEDKLDVSDIVLIDKPQTHGDRPDVQTLADIYERGQETFDQETYQSWLDERGPDDLASLIYTSGTTGEPKGVELTHWNFRSNVHQTRRRINSTDREDISIGTDTVSIAFLPLAHVFERLVGHFLMLSSGAAVGYAEHPDTLSEDLQLIRPTTGASVPRVYERIFDTMREQAGEEGIKRRIFDWSLDVAREFQQATDPGPVLRAKHGLADRLVYSTVKENIGGRMQFMVSGGGSLSEDLCRVFNGMGLTVIEGYGLTETSPVISVNPPDDIRPGTMGVPLVGVDVYIDESTVADKEFTGATGTVGELLVRGDNVSEGYWEKPEETDRAFTTDVPESALSETDPDEEGPARWFRTGDIVERTHDDFLVFRERLKQLLVLSTGKNVAPAYIEDRFATNDRIDQVMVIGDGRKFISALLVPNFERLRRWADTEGIDLPDDREALCEDDRVRGWVQEAVDEVNEELSKTESVKQFELSPHEWTAENDLLTPSMKKKRRNILDVYADRIDEMYEAEPEKVDADD
ncbi:AMP-dependent synthetase/ligase [Salinibaculum rarum]|uniref:AMP-dependent synthetase/ligase n=1 Tax=Salinibaculum rarum TaxID=3058903 RepID=UPI00265F677C|nr:long-chain fatty acid--CoA ligase [Salinibaculum sp. KK48]